MHIRDIVQRGTFLSSVSLSLVVGVASGTWSASSLGDEDLLTFLCMKLLFNLLATCTWKGEGAYYGGLLT